MTRELDGRRQQAVWSTTPEQSVPSSTPERSGALPSVLIASEAAVLRKRWRGAIQEAFATAEVVDRDSLHSSLAGWRPAALLLDLQLPHLGGIGGLAAIQRSRPTTKIIVLTKRPEAQEGVAAITAGARGYCDWAIDPGLLARALHAVQKGEIWVGRKLTAHLLEELTILTEQQPPANARAAWNGRLERIKIAR